MTKQQAGVWLFATVSTISFIAALTPVVKGEGPSGVFLGVGTVFLVIAIATARKARGSKGPPAG